MRSLSSIRMASMILACVAASVSVAQTSFNASNWMPPTNPLARVGYVEWAKALEKATNGELKPMIFTGTSLLPSNAHLSGLQDGIVQVSYHTGTYTPSDLPEDMVVSTLGIGMSDMIVAGFAVSDFYLNDPQMRARFDKLGIVFTGAQSTSQYNLMCTKAIASVADMSGIKVRMPSATHAEWARSVGAVPVAVPSSEMFTGLERGQLDCAANAANDLKSRSLWDVAKHITLLPLGPYTAGWMWAFNKDFWQQISEENRRIILDTNAKYLVGSFLAYESDSRSALAEAPAHGVTVIEPNQDLLASVEAFSKDDAYKLALQEASRLGADKPEDLIRRFQETMDKWARLLDGVDRNDAAALEAILKENLYDKVDIKTFGM